MQAAQQQNCEVRYYLGTRDHPRRPVKELNGSLSGLIDTVQKSIESLRTNFMGQTDPLPKDTYNTMLQKIKKQI